MPGPKQIDFIPAKQEFSRIVRKNENSHILIKYLYKHIVLYLYIYGIILHIFVRATNTGNVLKLAIWKVRPSEKWNRSDNAAYLHLNFFRYLIKLL